ncbi:hypothetical protein [Methylibium sp.]|uniref:hypothetical protein n=1 Tax=Methylibium sp. TaxID=2067992 RepID=UPI00286C91AC|nr:hypothetical protein [Methylibium sp.]
MTSLHWLFLLLGCAAAGATFALGRRSSTRLQRAPLPTEWALMARPALNADERRTLRLLREALPQHIVLAKLPLVRLCQPRDPQKVRYWFDFLRPYHVSFAVCSANGRVLAVVDLEPERGPSRRGTRIKQAVLEACRIRYLSCRAENLPPVGDLQLLLRQQGTASRPAPINSPPGFHQARSTLSDTVRTRRAERSARWADSGYPQDSFFAPDSRLDGAPSSEFAPLAAADDAATATANSRR